MIFSGAHRFRLLVGAAALCGAAALLFVLSVAKKARAAEPCTPAVMVVRHAEDMKTGNGPDILSEVGRKHAQLYIKLFEKYLAVPHSVGPNRSDVKVCPIGKIIAINPDKNSQNLGPSHNPYDTIKPLADALFPALAPADRIQTKDADGVSYSTVYNWNTARRKTLLQNSEPSTSTVIAWDKQGLNPSAADLEKEIESATGKKKLKDYGYTPLLKALPTNSAAIVGSGAYTPERTDFYVFTLQDPSTGKFGYAKAYKQCFSNDGGKTWEPWAAKLEPTDHPDDIKIC